MRQRRLGLIGGVSWHSTVTYYEGLNRGIGHRLGSHRSADLILRSLDYGGVHRCMETGDWAPLRTEVVGAARTLQAAGAEGLLLCSNSLNGLSGPVEAAVSVPLLHMADAVCAEADRHGWTRLALFGTSYTMGPSPLRRRLESAGLTLLIPPDPRAVDRIIVGELTRGVVEPASRQVFVDQLAPLIDAGAQAMVLGCTEIPLLIRPADVAIPVLDTVQAHVALALDWMVDQSIDHSRA